MPPPSQTILILGGGVGGVSTAVLLRERLGNPHRIVLVERDAAYVYAIGDVTSIPLAMGKPLPRAGVFAHAQAEAVVKTIGRAITGRGKTGTFDGHGECFIETGDSKAGFGKGNFYAEPRPQIAMSMPGWHWHAAKVAFEKYWLRRWF